MPLPDDAAAPPRPTVLLVDDDPGILRALERALVPLGYRLLRAQGGAEALDLLAGTEADVVISDMRMPGMDGAELLEAVRERQPNAVRMILTGYADLKSAMTSINRAEIYRFLTKPWDNNDLMLTVRNAVAHRHAQGELRLFARIFAASAEGMAVLDEQRRIVRINDAYARITGYAADELCGRPALLDEDAAATAAIWAALDANDHWQGEVRHRRRDGELRAHWLTLCGVGDERGRTRHHVVLISDVSERVQRESRLAELAFHDALTGLPNRALLTDRLTLALAQATRAHVGVGILFFDLDGFKAVNDTLGHGAGDLLLQGVAQRLASCVRKSDTVARLGGDEFVIVLGEVPRRERIEAIAHEALAALRQPFALAATEVHIGASIGLAVFPTHGETPATLLGAADGAMYAAKQAGKNCVRWAHAD